MFERFTDRARTVLVLAQEEARLLNHPFIGTEHLLLGLIHEGEGLAAKALDSLGVSLEVTRAKVAESIAMAEIAPSGSPPFTPRAKKVLELSLREALQLGHHYIGTEHLLLGLVREGEGAATQVLVQLGLDLGHARQRVIELMSGYQGAQGGTLSRPSGQGGVTGRDVARLASCSFCGRQPPESGQLVSGTAAFICEHCIRQWARRLDEMAPLDRLPNAPDIEQLAAQHTPTGPPPDDEDTARREIEEAFEQMGERSEDGAGLINVERGENLGPCQEELRRRFPQYVSEGAGRPPEKVKFLNGLEAVVWMNSPVIGIHEGRAVLVDGKWKVSRATYCGLVGAGGVTCPPPL